MAINLKKNQKRLSWSNPKLKIGRKKKYGYGVFAKDNIKKGELLAIFGGYLKTRAEEDNLPKNYRDYGLQITDNFVITNVLYGRKSELLLTDYFNHSCNPNAGFRGQIFLVAMRNIIRGEEITFDYGMVLHRSNGAKKYKFKCFCGSENCRGFVTEDDWKIPEIQKKYKDYFQQYLQDKIKNKKNM